MKSKTSCFNRGVAKNLLLRFWPLWAGYLIVLLLLLPILLRQTLQDTLGYIGRIPVLDARTAGMGEEMIVISFFVSILAAMAMFGYLYNSRSCGMMNALPLTRTGMFFTAWLTGLVPLLLADLLAALLCLPFVVWGDLSLWVLGTLLGVMALSKLCFYGFASLCAMLTGSLIILPLVFAVLSLTAYVAEAATRFVLSKVLFGLDPDRIVLSWLSPPVKMLESYTAIVQGVGESLTVQGLGVVALYGAAGLLFTFLAWRLYLRRRMETATDTVAIPVLKPVFKYCMAYGCGVLLSTFFHSAILMNQELGLTAALLTALTVLLGSLIGYFAAEMLIRKTVRVFRGSWRGWLIFAAAALLVLGACEFDLFGWEKSQPKAERVTAVLIEGTEYREPESIRQILELQRSIAAHKDKHETNVRDRAPHGVSCAACSVHLSYVLDSGRTVSRYYKLYGDAQDLQDPDSDLAKLETVFNLPEALRFRSVSKVPVTPENVVYFQTEFSYYDSEQDYYNSETVRFTPEEAVDFYQNAFLLDLTENTVGRRFVGLAGSPRETNVTIQMQITDGESFSAGYLRTESTSWYYVNLYEDNRHCIDWLLAHCDQQILIPEEAWPKKF